MRLALVSMSITCATLLNAAAATIVHAAAASVPPYIPHFDHVVVVVMSNHSYNEVIPAAPYITYLAAQGASLTNSYGITNSGQANYLALFSGSTQGLTFTTCPNAFSGDSLGSQLRSAGMSFVGYSEGLPTGGDPSCSSGLYTRTHAPWVDFTQLTVPPTVGAITSRPFAEFAGVAANSLLPTVAFVIPNLCNDMHGHTPECFPGSIATGDAWLQNNLAAYIADARSQNNLLILTWDEDDGSSSNHILTLFFGAHVKVGDYNNEATTHYRILATLEAMYGLPLLGAAANPENSPITEIWDDTLFANGFE